MKTLTTEEVLRKIQEVQDRYNLETEIFTKVCEAVKPFQGKVVNKRMCTAIEKILPEYTVSWYYIAGMQNVRIWGNGIAFEKRLSIFIAYDGEGSQSFKFTAEGNNHSFIKSNACYSYNSERSQKLEQLKSKVSVWVDRWNAAINEIQSIQTAMGNDCYPLSSIFDVRG